MSQDALYALRPAPERHASKTFRWVSGDRLELVHTYDAGWRFQYTRLGGIGGIEDLADAVRWVGSSDAERGAFLIRGRPREAVAPDQLVNRRVNDKEDRPEPPHWTRHPEGRRWLMIDVDDLPAPDWLSASPDASELTRAVEHATDHLPPCFRDATTFYQWSSSAGLVDEADTYRPGWEHLRLHLFYWCTRRVCSESVREWLKGYHEDHGVPIDWRVFNPVQPHFVAPPKFQNGPDPLAKRSGLLRGWHDEVTLPEEVLGGSAYDERQRKKRRRRERRRESQKRRPSVLSASQMEQREQRYAAAALEKACDEVATTPVGYRETTLRDEAYSIGGLVGAGALPGHKARSALIEAGVDAGLPRDEAEDKATRALEAGMESPRDMTDVRRKVSPDERPNGSQTSTPDNAPGVEDIRAHFSSDDSPSRDYQPPNLGRHPNEHGRALLDELMGRLSFDAFVEIVEHVRAESPEHLPDHCSFSHPPRVRAR